MDRVSSGGETTAIIIRLESIFSFSVLMTTDDDLALKTYHYIDILITWAYCNLSVM